MPGPKGERCADCYFASMWDADQEDPYFCHRYPPSVVPKHDYKDTPLPITVGADTWCGEFEPKAESR